MNLKSNEALSSISQNNIEHTKTLIVDAVQFNLKHNDLQDCLDLAGEFQQLGFIEYGILICDTVLKQHRLEPFLLLKSELLIDNNDIDSALDILLTIEEQSEYYVDALLIMADAYHLIDLDEVALYKLTIAKSLEPNEPVIDLALYELNVIMGNTQDAFHALSRIKDSNIMTSVDYNKKMSRLLLIIGEYEEAIHYLDQLSVEDHDSNSLFELGLAYYQLEEYARAVVHFERLIAQDPDFQSAYSYLGQCYIYLGRTNEGINILETALSNNPYDESLYIDLYEQYSKLHYHDKKENLVQKAKEYHIEALTLIVSYARDLLLQEQYDDVITLAIPYLDEDSELFWVVAKAYGMLEDDDNAKIWFEKAYELYSEDVSFLEDYAHYVREIGDFKRLKELLNQIKQLDPMSEFDLLEEFL